MHGVATMESMRSTPLGKALGALRVIIGPWGCIELSLPPPIDAREHIITSGVRPNMQSPLG